MSDTLSEADIQQSVDILIRLKPGYLPFQIFHQFARLCVTAPIELVPLRTTREGTVEILLLAREPNDPIWPDQLHAPGTVLRTSDEAETFADAWRRLFHDELKDINHGEPVFVQHLFHSSARGRESALIYYVEITGEAAIGTFYPVDALPDNLVPSHLDFIPQAVAAYKATVN